MKKYIIKRALAVVLALSLIWLAGCTSSLDNTDDPLSAYNIRSLLAVATATPVPAAPEATPSADATSLATQAPTDTPAAGRATATVYMRLESGDKGEQVTLLQNRLLELGYLDGVADGEYGATTKAAVRKFQSALGLSQTGIATVSLQEKLFLSSAPSYTPTAGTGTGTGTGAGTASAYANLVKGDFNNDVKKLQQRLIELGYLTGVADGQFGSKTETAIKAFQAAIGVSQTGVASSTLQEKLFISSAPAANTASTVTVKPTVAATSKYQALEPGDIGADVRTMQSRLKELGYFSGEATGNYYSQTTASVKAFQQAVGLAQSGTADSATLERLYADDAPAANENLTKYSDLQRGDQGLAVKNLQDRLIELGYMTTAADADYGSRTEKAVKLFQSTLGYAQTGIATAQLQTLIFASNAPKYDATATPTPVPATTPSGSQYKQLSPGDTGSDVRAMQERLQSLGYFDGEIGGNYLTKTTAAVKLFQAAIGVEQTGVATPELQTRIFAADAPQNGASSSATTPAPTYAALKRGDKGTLVTNMQVRLTALGFMGTTIDGEYGSRTENAIKAFQEAASLPVTGSADSATQARLFAADAPVKSATPTPSPYTEVKRGAYSEAVGVLQARLIELGYMTTKADNDYGSRTENAVKAFQAAVGLEQSGAATVETQEKLYAADAPKAGSQATPASLTAPQVTPAPYNELKRGAYSAEVGVLQARLIELGYMSTKADNDYGSRTENAVKLFQHTANLTEDGVATVETQALLFSESAPKYVAEATSQPQTAMATGETAVGTNVATAGTTPTATPTDAPSAPTVTVVPDDAESGYKALYMGDDGDEVLALQKRLVELKYLADEPDGHMGGHTVTAVKLFQLASGFTSNGIATPEVQAALFADGAIVNPDAAVSSGGASSLNFDTNYVELKLGDVNDSVKLLKIRLKDLGYFDGEIDDIFDANTAISVNLLLKLLDMEANGVASVAMQEVLYSSDAPYASDWALIYTKLDTTSAGAAVNELEERLIALGWLTGNADGVYDEATVAAVSDFKYRMGLDEDGVATIEVQGMLFMEDAPAFVEYKDLAIGDRGEEVLAIQLRLIELGYLEDEDINKDSIYGNGLKNALIQLQLADEVPAEEATGLATKELQRFVFSEHATLLSLIDPVTGERIG